MALAQSSLGGARVADWARGVGAAPWSSLTDVDSGDGWADAAETMIRVVVAARTNVERANRKKSRVGSSVWVHCSFLQKEMVRYWSTHCSNFTVGRQSKTGAGAELWSAAEPGRVYQAPYQSGGNRKISAHARPAQKLPFPFRLSPSACLEARPRAVNHLRLATRALRLSGAAVRCE
jgi:hypothetical protein